jgi:hypothetical protein
MFSFFANSTIKSYPYSKSTTLQPTSWDDVNEPTIRAFRQNGICKAFGSGKISSRCNIQSGGCVALFDLPFKRAHNLVRNVNSAEYKIEL